VRLKTVSAWTFRPSPGRCAHLRRPAEAHSPVLIIAHRVWRWPEFGIGSPPVLPGRLSPCSLLPRHLRARALLERFDALTSLCDAAASLVGGEPCWSNLSGAMMVTSSKYDVADGRILFGASNPRGMTGVPDVAGAPGAPFVTESANADLAQPIADWAIPSFPLDHSVATCDLGNDLRRAWWGQLP
jgi:hypothetical protein